MFTSRTNRPFPCGPQILLVVLFAASLAVTRASLAQDLPAIVEHDGEKTHIQVTGPRPLETLLEVLAQRYKWGINYEDPVYSPEDTKDAAAPAWRKAHPNEVGLLLPKGSTFTTLIHDSSIIANDKPKTIAQILAEYKDTKNPGKFRLVEINGVAVAVGSDRYTGASEAFSAEIEPEVKSVSLDEDLQHLVAKCAARSGVAIVLGTMPGQVTSMYMIAPADKMMGCREELLRIMSVVPSSLRYALLYDIGSRSFVLNIVPVG